MGIPSPVTRDNLRNISAFSGYIISRGFRISGKNCRSREPNDQHITREKAYISQQNLFSPDSALGRGSQRGTTPSANKFAIRPSRLTSPSGGEQNIICHRAMAAEEISGHARRVTG